VTRPLRPRQDGGTPARSGHTYEYRDKIFSLLQRSSHAYYHFLAETLPKLLLLQMDMDDPRGAPHGSLLLDASFDNSWSAELLRLLGFPRDRLLFRQPGKVISPGARRPARRAPGARAARRRRPAPTAPGRRQVYLADWVWGARPTPLHRPYPELVQRLRAALLGKTLPLPRAGTLAPRPAPRAPRPAPPRPRCRARAAASARLTHGWAGGYGDAELEALGARASRIVVVQRTGANNQHSSQHAVCPAARGERVRQRRGAVRAAWRGTGRRAR